MRALFRVRSPRSCIAAFALVLPLVGCGSQSTQLQAGNASGRASAPSTTASSASSVAASAKPGQSGGAAGQLRPVKFVWATQSANFLPAQVGVEAGIFQKHGIDLQLVYTGTGPTTMAAIISGDAQFAELADPSVTTSALEGSGVEWIAISVPKPTLALFSHPAINAVEDLKGKKVGVTSLGSLTALFAELVLQQHGLDPKKDVQVLAVGGGLEAQAAITNNQIDALIASADTPLAGQKILVDLRSGFDFPQVGLAATKSFVQKEPQLVQDMVDAFVESIRRFKTDQALAEKIDIREFKRTDPQGVRAEVKGAADALSDDVTPTAKQIQTVLSMIASSNEKAKTAKPQDFFDDRFGKAAAK
jgi:NitT/TauT family transport system substrate-binding protein